VPAGVWSVGEREYGTASVFLMNHLAQHWASVLAIPDNDADIMRYRKHINLVDLPTFESVVPLIEQYPYVRHALLAISAAHLRHHTKDTRSHSIAEHFQQSVSLRSFRTELTIPLTEDNHDRIDGLVLGGMFINMFTMLIPPDEDECPMNKSLADPFKSWVFSTSQDRLGWLTLVLGQRSLMMEARPWRDYSACYDLSTASGGIYTDGVDGTSPIPLSWLIAFGLDEDIPGHVPASGRHSISDKETFREPLSLLAEMSKLKPSRSRLFHYMIFMSRLQPGFLQLLYVRDEKAMWMVGYWLGLLCRAADMWWLSRRVQRDHAAVIKWLELLHLSERPGLEGMIWRQLMDDLRGASKWEESELVR
jgi:hypothetical protein